MDCERTEPSNYVMNHTSSEQSPMRSNYLTFYKSRRSISGQRMIKSPSAVDERNLENKGLPRKRPGASVQRSNRRISGSALCLDDNIRKHATRSLLTSGLVESAHEGRSLDYSCDAIGSGKTLLSSHGLTSFAANNKIFEPKHYASLRKNHANGHTTADIWNKHSNNYLTPNAVSTDIEDYKNSTHFERVFGERHSIEEFSGINARLSSRKLFFVQEFPKKMNTCEKTQDPSDTAVCNKRQSYIDKTKNLFGCNHRTLERNHAVCPDKCSGNFDLLSRSGNRIQNGSFEPDHEIYATYISDHCRKNRRGRISNKTSDVVLQDRLDLDRNTQDLDIDTVSTKKKPLRHYISYNTHDVSGLSITSRYGGKNGHNEQRNEESDLSYFEKLQSSESVSNIRAENRVGRDRNVKEETSEISGKSTKRRKYGSGDSGEVKSRSHSKSSRSSLSSKRRMSKRRQRSPPSDAACYIQNAYNKPRAKKADRNKNKHKRFPSNERHETVQNRPERQPNERSSFYSGPMKTIIPETPTTLIDEDILLRPPWTCTKWATEVFKDSTDEPSASQWAYEIYSDTCLMTPNVDLSTDGSNKSCPESNRNFRDNRPTSTGLEEVNQNSSDYWKRVLCTNNLAGEELEHHDRIPDYQTEMSSALRQFGRNPYLVANRNPLNFDQMEPEIDDEASEMWIRHVESVSARCGQIREEISKEIDKLQSCQQSCGTMSRGNIGIVIGQDVEGSSNRSEDDIQADALKSSKLTNSNTNPSLISQDDKEITIVPVNDQMHSSVTKNNELPDSIPVRSQCSVDEILISSVNAIKEDIQTVFDRLSSLEMHRDHKIFNTALSLKESMLSVLDQATVASRRNSVTKVNSAAEIVKNAIQKLAEFSNAYSARNNEDDNKLSYEIYKTGKDEYNAAVEARECHQDINVFPIDVIRQSNMAAQQILKHGRSERNEISSRIKNLEPGQKISRENVYLINDNVNEKRLKWTRRNSQRQRKQLENDEDLDESLTESSRSMRQLRNSDNYVCASTTESALSDEASGMLRSEKQKKKLPYGVLDEQTPDPTASLQSAVGHTIVSSSVRKSKKRRKDIDVKKKKYANLLDYPQLLRTNKNDIMSKTSAGKQRRNAMLNSGIEPEEARSLQHSTAFQNRLNLKEQLTNEAMHKTYCDTDDRVLAAWTQNESPEADRVPSIQSSYTHSEITDQSSVVSASPTLMDNLQYITDSASDTNEDEDTLRSESSSKPLITKKAEIFQTQSSQNPKSTTHNVKIVYKIKSRTSISKSQTSVSETMIIRETEEKPITTSVFSNINKAISGNKKQPRLQYATADFKNISKKAYSNQVSGKKYERYNTGINTAKYPVNQAQILYISPVVLPGAEIRNLMSLSQQSSVVNAGQQLRRGMPRSNISSDLLTDNQINNISKRSNSETSLVTMASAGKKRKGLRKRRKTKLTSEIPDSKQNTGGFMKTSRDHDLESVHSPTISSKKSIRDHKNAPIGDTQKNTPMLVLQSEGAELVSKFNTNKIDNAILSIDSYEKAIRGAHNEASRGMLLHDKQLNETHITESEEKVQIDKDHLDGVSASQLNLSIMKLYDEINKLRLKLESSTDDNNFRQVSTGDNNSRQVSKADTNSRQVSTGDTNSRPSPTIVRRKSNIKLTAEKRKYGKNCINSKPTSFAPSSVSSASSSRDSLLGSEKRDIDSTGLRYFGASTNLKKEDKKKRERRIYTESRMIHREENSGRTCCVYNKYGLGFPETQLAYFQHNEEGDTDPASYEELPDACTLKQNVEYFEQIVPSSFYESVQDDDFQTEQESEICPQGKDEEEDGSEYWSEYRNLEAADESEFYNETDSDNESIDVVSDDHFGVVTSVERRLESEQSAGRDLPILSESNLIYTSNIFPSVNLEVKQEASRAQEVTPSSSKESTVTVPKNAATSHCLLKCKMEPSEPDVWPHSFVYSKEGILLKNDPTFNETTMMQEDSQQLEECKMGINDVANNCRDYNQERSSYSELLKASSFDNFKEPVNRTCSQTSENDLYFSLNSNPNPNKMDASWSGSPTGSSNEKINSSHMECQDRLSLSEKQSSENTHLKQSGESFWTDAEESVVKKEEDYIPQSHVPRIVQCVKDMLFGSTKAQGKDTSFENATTHVCPATPIPSAGKKFSNNHRINKSDRWINASSAESDEIPTVGYVNARRKSRSNSKLQNGETEVMSSPMLQNYIFKKRDIHEMSRSHTSIDDSESSSQSGSACEAEEINEKSPNYSEDLMFGSGVSNYNLQANDLLLTSHTKPRQSSLNLNSSPHSSVLKCVEETDKTLPHYCDAINANGTKRLTARETCLVSISNVSNTSDSRSDKSFTNSFGMDKGYFRKHEKMPRNSYRNKSPNLVTNSFHEDLEKSTPPTSVCNIHPEMKSSMDKCPTTNPSTSGSILIASVENMMQQRRTCYVEHCGFRQKKLENIGGCGSGDMNREEGKSENNGNRSTKNEAVGDTVSNDNNSSIDSKRIEDNSNQHERNGIVVPTTDLSNRTEKLYSKHDVIDAVNFNGDNHLFHNTTISDMDQYNIFTNRSVGYENDSERLEERSFEEAVNTNKDVDEVVSEGYDDDDDGNKKVIVEDEEEEVEDNFSDDDSIEREMLSGNTTLDEDELEGWYRTTDDESSV